MKANSPYILWLPSWYPNKLDPFIGDFVQRHARATAAFFPVVVVHFVQAGPSVLITELQVVYTESGLLKEYIVYLPHKPILSGVVNKLRYQVSFYKQAKAFLYQLLLQQGKPAGVHVHVPMKTGILARWIKQKFQVPYILTEHSSAYVPEVEDSFSNRHWWYRRQVKKIIQEAKAITTVSGFLASVLQELFQLPLVAIVRNVVNTALFHPAPLPAVQPFVYLHVSGMESVKNPLGLLRAFAALKETHADWRLVLVGPDLPEIKAQIKNLGIEENIRLTGMVSYAAVAREMQKAHALVLFSKMENAPCVISEALCCGLPVIASKVGGIVEMITEENGLLVDSGSEWQMVEALKRVRANYSVFDRSLIAVNAQALYNTQTIGSQIFNLYKVNFHIGH